MKKNPGLKKEVWHQFRLDAKNHVFKKKNEKITLAFISISSLMIFPALFWSYWILFLAVPMMLLSVKLARNLMGDYDRHLSYLIRHAGDDSWPDAAYSKGYLDNSCDGLMLKQTFTISNGFKEGPSNFYLESGTLLYTVLYQKGVLQSKTWFDAEGKIVQEGEYLNGEYCNRSTEYYPDGNKRMTHDGEVFRFFDKNGTLRVQINTDAGSQLDDLPTGDWHEYDKDGNVRKTLRFSDRLEDEVQIGVVTSLSLSNTAGEEEKEYEFHPAAIKKHQFHPSYVFHRHYKKKGEEKTMHIAGAGWTSSQWSTRPVLKLSDVIHLGQMNRL